MAACMLNFDFIMVARCFGSCSTTYASQAHSSYGFQKNGQNF